MKRLINVFFNALLILVLVASVFFLVKGKLSPDGNPEIFGHKLLVVISGSMEPSIHVGSIVGVRETASRNLKPNDVITFEDPEDPSKLITHRIISQTQDGQFITKGDANSVEDTKPVPPGNVVGEAVFSIPYLGYLAVFARSKLGMLLLIAVPGSLIIIGELIKLVRYLKEEEAAKTSERLDIK